MARSRPAKSQGDGNGDKKGSSSTPARRARTGADAGSRRNQPRTRQAAQPPKQGSVTKAVQQERRGGRFISDMIAELRKIQWPTRSQLLQSVAVVLLVVIIVVVYLWAVDAVVSRVVNAIF